LKKLLLVTAVFAAAVTVFVVLTIPPRRLTLKPIGDGSLPGILHVHTSRSDGSRSPDDIAAAAARAGLKFVVFTDHGDGTRAPDAPAYRSGVLCLDGVEISTTGGHYIALDMPAAPYPLAGEPRDVVEDVRRLGGFGIAAHPDSPKIELRWREWTAPFDGIELLNPDTSWRLLAQERGLAAKRRLLTALIDYPFRPSETIASLVQPSGALYSWQALTARRRVVAIGGVDAHANLQWRSDPGDARAGIPLPGYEASFRMMSVHATLEREFSGNAAADAGILMRAIRGGHLYTAVDGVASPPAFEFMASNERGTVHEGDELAVGGPVTLRVRSNAPAEFTTIVHDGMHALTTVRDPQDLTVHAPDKPAVYWVEIVSTGRPHPITWLYSNPIYVRGPEPLVREAARPASTDCQLAHGARRDLVVGDRARPKRRETRDSVPIRIVRRVAGRSGGRPGVRCAARTGAEQSANTRGTRRASDAYFGPAARRQRGSGGGAVAALGVPRSGRSGEDGVLRRPDARRRDAHVQACARRHPQHPVRRRHDECEARIVGTDLDSEGGAGEMTRA